jgi:PleD family two-component response regulator
VPGTARNPCSGRLYPLHDLDLTSREARPPEPDRASKEEGARTVRILLISDEPWWIRSIRSVLDTPGTLIADLGSAAARPVALAGIDADAVLIHAELKSVAAVDLLRILRMEDASEGVPVLLISDRPIAREARTTALRAGAFDCLTAPLDAQELSLKLRVFIGLKRGAERAREVGLVDSNTGLYNPVGVMKRAGELTRASQRYGRPLACAVFSMAVNAEAPDAGAAEETGAANLSFTREMEKALVRTLRNRRRSSDIIGRIDGGEIVVLAPETDSEGVINMAARLMEATEQELSRFPGYTHRVHAGCYAVEAADRGTEIDATQMILRATEALRRAQDGPSGQIERFV